MKYNRPTNKSKAICKLINILKYIILIILAFFFILKNAILLVNCVVILFIAITSKLESNYIDILVKISHVTDKKENLQWKMII